MRHDRVFPNWIWIPTLLLGLALVAGLMPSGDEARAPAPKVTGYEAGDARPAGPVLVGRGSADPVRAPGENAGVADSSDPSAGAARSEDAPDLEDTADEHIRDGAALTESHPLVAPVIAVQERHTRELLKHPLVVGTATGMNERGEICVVVLAKAEITDLPRFLGRTPVMVFVTGELFASKGKPPGKGGGGGGGGGGGASVDPTARFDRPVPIGVSTGHTAITAGTIGCRVTDGTSVWALSNNHVYANENEASIDDRVIQPGTYDGGSSPADDLGTLFDWVDLKFMLVQNGGANVMDAALALTDTDTLSKGTPSDGYGLPRTTTASASINLRVRKYGRTTGQTNGRIFAINASVNVGYSTGVAGFVDQLVITPGSYSAGGDSGSLIVVQKGSNARKPVALLFAGSSSSTIASPIDPILTTLNVDIDGDGN